ncbi:hypothetical protein [Mesobacillus jeotgali]|uniref:hypothetical protein n=1 Tax=Mesobacillus jeotgali TaxID=129985 RepID=UPI001782713E|nr:hypothetical protein [Mesobacillus jeotgali]UYZ24017.1 hypothetical protein FOF60_10975 [Mesobacillus jeotgali]
MNQGVDPSKIEKHFNLAYGKLEELLLSNNYKFYSFMNFWSTLDEEQLCHDLVSHLNKGNTIYDLSGKYLRGNKERLRFVSMVEKLLDKYQYEYNFSLKVWDIKASSNKKGLILIVEDLNTGKPLKEVAEKFEVTPASLRLSLKNANYRYDPLFQVWTTKERKELVDQLSLDIKNGLITIEELRKKGFDSRTLETLKYLSDHKQNTVLETKTNSIDEKVSNGLNKDNIINLEYGQLEKQDEINLEHAHLKAETASSEADIEKKALIKTQEDNDLSVEDIKILKEIIGFWTQESQTKSDSRLKQINIFIESPILKKLEIYC